MYTGFNPIFEPIEHHLPRIRNRAWGSSMKYEDMQELRRRMDVYLTEPETWIELVKDAVQKGNKVQGDLERLRKLSQSISKAILGKGIILKESDLLETSPAFDRVVGIDGSFQLVGGAGGKWYAPISVARILFDQGYGTQPSVDLFWAGIEEIDEKDDPKPNHVAEVLMLAGEAKALLAWGSRKIPSYVFLDGPVVDPPVFTYTGKDYVRDRCQAIKKCLESSRPVGCVKRSRDHFFLEHFKRALSGVPEESYLDAFPSDQHLMAYLFAHSRQLDYKGPLFTQWIDVSEVSPLYKSYKDEGIHIASLFFQKDIMTQALRLDIPFLEDPNSIGSIKQEIQSVCKAVQIWTYPGMDYPLPVILAHDKCNIRAGSAEVLYDEIMTRSRTTDPINQTILSQLR